MRKFLINTLALVLMLGMVSFGGCDKQENDSNEQAPLPTPAVDTISPSIDVEYEYKIVIVDTETSLPKVTFDEQVTAKYELDGVEVNPEDKFTPSEVGKIEYRITATDTAGNKTVKEIYYTVTDDVSDLNKIYAIDDVAGLEKQAGILQNGLNNLAVRLIKSNAERPVDLNNNAVPNLYLDENGNVVANESSAVKTVDEYLQLNCQNVNGRMVLENPLYKNWDEQFSQLYFYVYNAGLKSATFIFNNYSYTVAPNSGWTKIVIAPKTVDGEVVTDDSLISSLGGGYDYAGLFDLEDCVGATLRITAAQRYERVMVTAIYGKPIQA